MSKFEKFTPVMRQYLNIKKNYKDAILMFRMGDFYEMFFEDAKEASSILGIALTSRDKHRGNPIPMCGVPYHSVDTYIARLIKANKKVAICEQVEDPKKAKGIVKREVVRVITPGTVLDTNVLEAKENNFIASYYQVSKKIGVSVLDISTGEFYISEFSGDDIFNECKSFFEYFNPKELIVPENFKINSNFLNRIGLNENIFISKVDTWNFSLNEAEESLKEHFKVKSLAGFGCQDYKIAIQSAGALISYLKDTQKSDLSHVRKIKIYNREGYLYLDASTIKNLELVRTIYEGKREGSLLYIIDKTLTAMGGRKLKSWLLRPLCDIKKINDRLDAVSSLVDNSDIRAKIQDYLKRIQDIERIISRVSLGVANARDLIALKNSLLMLPVIISLVKRLDCQIFKYHPGYKDSLEDIIQLIDKAIEEDPPVSLKEGGIIKSGFDNKLDELKRIATNAKEIILQIEKKEKKATKIPSLRIGYNKVFGYYIEVSKSYIKFVPKHYIRKQTLVNAERYITEELKTLEEKILTAEEKMFQLEYELFLKVRERVRKESERILTSADFIATVDCLCSLAEVAEKYNYTRPEIREDDIIEIINGRHPVVEQIHFQQNFVPNDTYLDRRTHQILIITGPNMAGKSTYIRQVALIVLMAQMGSFVPADKARIGIVDRIFSRVGASDNIYSGLSTFMMEMIETANILNNATPKSLIILDEIGRGTSTFDGLSIAWAVTEYLHDNEKISARTLFATHYHQLTQLANTLPKVKNFTVEVKEWQDNILFLHKIKPGTSDRSYGIQVSKLAGIPEQVIERAKEILKNLEKVEFDSHGNPFISTIFKPKKRRKMVFALQQSLFSEEKKHPILKELEKLDLNNLTPIEALNILNKWKNKIKSNS